MCPKHQPHSHSLVTHSLTLPWTMRSHGLPITPLVSHKTSNCTGCVIDILEARERGREKKRSTQTAKTCIAHEEKQWELARKPLRIARTFRKETQPPRNDDERETAPGALRGARADTWQSSDMGMDQAETAGNWTTASPCFHWAMVQNQWYHFGIGAPPILEPMLVGIGMFTDGIGVLTHGHLAGLPMLVTHTHILGAVVEITLVAFNGVAELPKFHAVWFVLKRVSGLGIAPKWQRLALRRLS